MRRPRVLLADDHQAILDRVIEHLAADPAFITAAENVGASGYVLKCNLCTHLVAALRRALERRVTAIAS